MADPLVAVANYPEGAGHATRMLAVAQALERRGASVALAGGGPGAKFVDLHGYEQYHPADVDYIEDFQDGGNLLRVITHSVPKSGKRVLDYVRWLRRVDPDGLVTDDMFAAMAAPIARVPLYALTHNAEAFYEHWIDTRATRLLNWYQGTASRTFFYPAVWPPNDDEPDRVERVGPIALEPSEAADGGAAATEPGPVDADATATAVLVVPSHYSDDERALADRLADAGHDVTLVGGPDWEPVPAMLPVLEAVDVVVCSGYSTVMEAAVAGTPCVVRPHTDEQRGVAWFIDRADVPGFVRADGAGAVLGAVADPPAPPAHENGAGAVAETVLADLA